MKSPSIFIIVIILFLRFLSVLYIQNYNLKNCENIKKINVLNNELNETVQNASTDKNNKKENYVVSENLISKYSIKQIDEGIEIKNFHYALNQEKYFLVKKTIENDEDIGFIPIFKTYFDDIYVSSILLVDYNCWEEFKFRRNRSIKPVMWLDNDKAIVIDSLNMFIYDVNKKTKEILELPKGVTCIYDIDINDKSNKLILTTDFSIKGANEAIYTYDFEKKSYEELYSYTKSHYIECMWGIGDNVYFDSIDENNKKVIKNMDISTGEIKDFKEQSYLLNISTDYRYLTYVDEKKKLTIIFDLVKEKAFEMPITEELEWKYSKNQFASVSSNCCINIVTINDTNIEINKYDMSNLLSDGEYIYNLQFHNDKLRFDIVNINIYDNGYYKIAKKINKVATYEIIVE